jgi:catechol 2,3-dioxygenase-like lactoylglutathione lyase family enzyme
MEQVGINGTSKSHHYYDRRFMDRQPLPQMGDFDERIVAESREWTPADGFKVQDVAIEQGVKERFDVAGYLLPRPFKITDIGPIGIFVRNFDEAVTFYENVMGLTTTVVVEYEGYRCAYLRHGREHHCLKVYEMELREILGLSPHTNTVSAGLRLGSYKQLKDAVDYLTANGCKFIEQPEELAPGIDYSAYVLDPDGHCIQLYYYMELLGRDGKPQPAENLKMQNPWPETVEPHEDTYTAQTFMGPLG